MYADVCSSATWQTLVGRQSAGANLYAQYTTVADCQAACLNVVPNCVAVDFTSSSQCWLYSDPSSLVRIYSNPNITQYRIVGRCPGVGKNSCHLKPMMS